MAFLPYFFNRLDLFESYENEVRYDAIDEYPLGYRHLVANRLARKNTRLTPLVAVLVYWFPAITSLGCLPQLSCYRNSLDHVGRLLRPFQRCIQNLAVRQNQEPLALLPSRKRSHK